MRRPTDADADLNALPSLVAGDEHDRPRARAATPAAARQTAAGGGGSIMTLVILGLVIVGGGWLFYVEHEQLQQTQASLTQATERIRLLEERLQVTGADLSESLDETGKEMKSQLGYWESEIRKLWDITNGRNKEGIQKNAADLRKLEEAVANQRSLVDRMDALTAQHEKALGSQGFLTAKLAQIEGALGNAIDDQRGTVDKANSAVQAVNKLKSDIDEIEQAIEAMNAFRAQMNRNLQTVTADVTALRAQMAE